MYCFKSVIPILFYTTNWFNVRQYFQGLAFEVWRINTAEEHDMTGMKTGIFKI